MSQWILLLLLTLAPASTPPPLHAQAAPRKATAAKSAPTSAADDTASQPDDSSAPANLDPSDSAAPTPDLHSDLWRYLTSYEFALALLVLLFGVLVIFSASWTLKGKDVTPEQALRFYGVIVILVGTILLIVAGLNNNQIAPAVGLFGTLAGYLLGRNQSPPPQATGQRQDQPQERDKKDDANETIIP